MNLNIPFKEAEVFLDIEEQFKSDPGAIEMREIEKLGPDTTIHYWKTKIIVTYFLYFTLNILASCQSGLLPT